MLAVTRTVPDQVVSLVISPLTSRSTGASGEQLPIAPPVSLPLPPSVTPVVVAVDPVVVASVPLPLSLSPLPVGVNPVSFFVTFDQAFGVPGIDPKSAVTR